VYTAENSDLPSNKVTSIVIDSQGNKWIGTLKQNEGGCDGSLIEIWPGGLAKFDGKSWTAYNVKNSDLPSDYVTSIVVDAQGNKWIGTREREKDGWEKGVELGGGLAVFDGKNWTVYTMKNSDLPSNNVTSIVIDAQGNKWISTEGGLAKFDGRRWVVYNMKNSGLPSNVVTSIAIDLQGNKWIGTE
ncbi:MAG: two-component regulator propeller domain-containing protein, partial [Candidatus Kryptonium sp.]